jgi:hypothetical protein
MREAPAVNKASETGSSAALPYTGESGRKKLPAALPNYICITTRPSICPDRMVLKI